MPADTLLSASMTTVQRDSTRPLVGSLELTKELQPFQKGGPTPRKVRTTVVPLAKDAEHVAGQLMPTGEEDMMPKTLDSSLVTVSVNEEGAGAETVTVTLPVAIPPTGTDSRNPTTYVVVTFVVATGSQIRGPFSMQVF
jgi:hypothetical protein